MYRGPLSATITPVLENPFAIMLAQLKTVVLVKEAINLAFFRLVGSIWSIVICGFDYRLEMSRNKDFSSETRQSILILKNED